ncbi:hypothetical protein [uncultured Paraglaciecola sp.]|uniref:hypothetical protein n=1 Tax=uncultured Paraglaciecola sp. TaxID=1765024 RepID=UPI0030DA3448
MAIARHIALNILRNETPCKKGIKAKRFQAALDTSYGDKSTIEYFLSTHALAL